MKKFITSLLLAVVAIGVRAADPTVIFDLTTAAAVNQCTQTSLKYDHDDLTVWAYGPTGLVMQNYDIKDGYYDDYLITPVLNLEAGNEYGVQFLPQVYSIQFFDSEGFVQTNANVKVWLGQGDNLEEFEVLGLAEHAQYDASKEYEFKFVPKTSGAYKIAFEGYTYRLYLKKTKIVNYGPSAVPSTPDDFTLTPDPDGGKDVTISFTMPSTTATGQALTNPTYTLYHGIDKVDGHIDASAAPGQKVEIKLTVAESGKNIFSIIIKEGAVESERLNAETYVGVETATPPTNVNYTMVNGKYQVTWDAPEVGTHGVTLLPEKLTYSISRYVDGVEQWISDDVKTNSFTDDFESTGIHKLKYAVAAKYGSVKKFTAYTESPEMVIGTMNMPFGDSFAEATMDNSWTNESLNPANSPYASCYWQVKKEIKDIRYFKLEGREYYNGDILPFDQDNGLIFYSDMNSYNYSARLSTAPISYRQGEIPVLSFAFFENRTHSQDILQIQIRVNKGEWVNVEDGLFVNGGHEAEQWVKCTVPLSKYMTEDTAEFEVGFLAKRADTYGQYIAIDAIKIINAVDKDMAIDMFNISEEALAGGTIEMTIKVANNGKEEVAADAYSVEIDHNFAGDIAVTDLKAIPSNGSQEYHVSVPVNSIQLYNVNELNFTARVVYAGDETPANNMSERKTLKPAYSAGNGTRILESAKAEDGTVTLKWEPATDLIRTPVNIRESFEGFKEDSFGPFNGWVTVDIDGKGGSTWYSASGSQFNVVTKDNPTPGNRDGENVIGVTVGDNAQQDDWIISPLLNTVPESELKLEFLYGVKQLNEGYSGADYMVEVLYCTETEYQILNPQKSFTNTVETFKFGSSNTVVPHDNKLHPVATSNVIPGEAKYIALHFITKHPYGAAMWVDDIHVYEELGNPLQGYNVYSLATGSRLNDELIEPTATEFSFKVEAAEEPKDAKLRAANATNDPFVFVASVYPDGEAQPVNIWDYEKNQNAEGMPVQPVKVVTTIVSDDWANMEVYTGADKTEPVTIQGITTKIETEENADIYIYAKDDCYISEVTDAAQTEYTVPAKSITVKATSANTVTVSVVKVVRDKNLTVFVEEKAATAVALTMADSKVPEIAASLTVNAGYNTFKFAKDDQLQVAAAADAVEVYVDGEKVDPAKAIGNLTETTVVKIFSETPQAWTMNYNFGEGVEVEVYHDHVTKIESPAQHSVFHGTHVAIKPVKAKSAAARAEASKLEVKVNGVALEPNAQGYYEFTAEQDVEIAVAKAESGIDAILVEGQDAEIYNLQGLKVTDKNLTPGVYIIRANGQSQKVYVK